MAGPPSDLLAGMEASAIEVLTRAVDFDKHRRFPEASACYQEGLQLLMNVIKDTANERKKCGLREKALQYMDRAEKMKEQAQKQQAKAEHKHIRIESNSTGNSYEKVFGTYLNGDVTVVEVDDAYIRSVHQIFNFLRFCELLVKSCQNLKCIRLTTTADTGSLQKQQQMDRLNQLKESLRLHKVNLKIDLSNVLHDREIRLDNGWVIKIGRGLDYFKPLEGKFSIGYCDFDLRPCNETTVDIFHNSSNGRLK